MPAFSFNKPRLPSYVRVRAEPPDESGDEILFLRTERRQLKLKGQAFREFVQSVVPLLDGRHTTQEIEASVSDLFNADDLERALQLLADNDLLEDASTDPFPEATRLELAPQLAFFRELGLDAAAVQDALSRATVSIVGLGGAGASVAVSLATARVGTLRCVDGLPVATSDIYLAPAYTREDVGTERATAISHRIAAVVPDARVIPLATSTDSEADLEEAVRGSDLVVCCADPGLVSIFYKLNRICLRSRTKWISCSVSGFEAVIGPTVDPYETPCYLCYTMRSVACAHNPEDEFAYQQFLDRRKRDDSDTRENLVVGHGAVGNLVALEAIKTLTGMLAPASLGRIVVLDLLRLTSTPHVVLRKPWCPACFGGAA